MKKLTITALAAGAAFLLTAPESIGQDKAPARNWGHWQLVSNVATPRLTTLQFYTSDGVLMHEERVEGRRLNTARRKVCRQLDNALAAAYQAWTNNKALSPEGKSLLARRTKSKKSSCSASTPE